MPRYGYVNKLKVGYYPVPHFDDKIIIPITFAGVAQLVEQLIRNQQVVGSNPLPGFFFCSKRLRELDTDQSYYVNGSLLTIEIYSFLTKSQVH